MSNPEIVHSRVRDATEIPDVSVVIPVYNGAATLAEELEALANQETTVPFEVVISDNGSTDNTREVALHWADRFAALTIVDSSQVQGVSHARNEGARAAQGSKVLICDADDVVCPVWVETLVNGLGEFDAVGGAARLDRLNSAETIRGQAPITQGLNRVFGFLPYALGGSFGIRRDVLISVGGFDSSYLRGHEEADFCWRLQLAGYTLGWCPAAVVDYRQRSDSYGAARQNFHYAKSSILLWCRYSRDHALNPVSFRAAVKTMLLRIFQSYKLMSAETRRQQARELGWRAGVIAGHLYYRFLGRVPERSLMTSSGKDV